MDQERLRAELEAKRKPGLVVKRLGGLKGAAAALTGRGAIPRQIRALVAEAFAADPYARYSLVGLKRREIGELLKDHSESDWAQAVQTLLPHLGASAEAACQIVALRPYQDGLTRKPFRCPRSPEVLAYLRGRWLLNTTLLVGEYEEDIRWIAERAAAFARWS